MPATAARKVVRPAKVVCRKCETVISRREAIAWCGRPFCAACVDAAGLLDVSPKSFVESVQIPLVASLWRGLKSAVYLTTLMSILISGIFFLLIIAVLFGALFNLGAVPRVPLRVIELMGMFFGFSWLFFAVITFPLMLIPAAFSRRRTISIAGTDIVFETRYRTKRGRLADCRWFTGCIDYERFGCFFQGSPLVQILIKEDAWIDCGFLPEWRSRWEALLALLGAERWERIGWRNWLFPAIGHTIFGGIIGGVSGLVLRLVTGNPEWVVALTFLGLLDGALCAMALIVNTQLKPDELQEHLPPAYAAAITAVLGVKIGIVIGLAGIIFCAAINGLFGWILGCHIHRRAAERHAAQIASEQTG